MTSQGPFFVSDMHFGHANIIGYCDRPYEDVAAMNDALVVNWNKRVGMDDDIYILGDTSFLSLYDTLQIFDTLKGRKHLIFGNHDHRYRNSTFFLNHFVFAADYHEMQVQDGDHHQHVVLCHFPILSWHRMMHKSWMLHGHTHGSIQQQNVGVRRYDVGVDVNNYAPVSYQEIKAKFAPLQSSSGPSIKTGS